MVLVTALTLTGLAVAAGQSDDKDGIILQKDDLELIRREVEHSRRQLDSLKQAELKIQKDVANYDQRIVTNRKIVSRLNRELNQLQTGIVHGEEQLTDSRQRLYRAQRRYLGNIRRFYFVAHRPMETYVDQVNDELDINRRIIYLTALASFESGKIAQASDFLQQSEDQLTELTGEKKRVAGLKKKKETATALEKTRKQKDQRALERLRRKKSEEADRILTLQHAAEEIERIIARLEQRQRETTAAGWDPSGGASAFATLRGQLPSPCRGKITVRFGHSVDEITKLKSFSPGISIRGRAGRDVVTVADGKVVYVGNLRGYGNFVIIDHDGQYYSTYGGLGTAQVEVNQYLPAGTLLAKAGRDGLVKFELRHGREPLDPVKWIRIDSF